MSDKEIDEFSGVETTGHEWDGIKELNNPLPRWWLWTFYATIVFSLGYVVVYPAIPLINGATPGVFGHSTRADVVDQIETARAGQSGFLKRIETASFDEIRDQADLYQFAVAGGQSAFKVHCSQCHGSGAQGAAGYPNLNDDDWLWGGTTDDIHATIAHGVRFDQDDETRVSDMPAFGLDETLSRTESARIADFVLSMSGQDHDAAAAAAGAPLYEENCASCHGDAGAGDRELGAPRLTDPIWLYGGSRDQVAAQIQAPNHGVMPAWSGRLDDVTIKQLTIYVHGLGGGE